MYPFICLQPHPRHLALAAVLLRDFGRNLQLCYRRVVRVGRYTLVDLSGPANHYAGTVDRVVGKNGDVFVSPRAKIWRWCETYQNDFAARTQWTLGPDRATVNHAPVVVVNGGSSGPEMVYVEVEAGSEIMLDASESYDPDGDRLSFRWLQYKEPTKAHSEIHWLNVGEVHVEAVNETHAGSVVRVTVPEPQICAMHPLTGQALVKGQSLHLVLEVKDDGVPSMVTYKRVLVQVANAKQRGGTGEAFRTWAEAYACYLKN